MIKENSIIRKSISMLLIITLLITGFFITPNTAHALTVEKAVTKYHLDIGVQQIWGVFTGNYDSRGQEIIDWDDNMGMGSSMKVDTSISFNQNVYNVSAYEYSASKFKWEDPNYSSNVGSQDYYGSNYRDYASKNISVYNATSSGKSVSFSYSATMDSPLQYNLTERLNRGQIGEIFRLMAGPEPADAEAAVKKNFPSLYSKLNAGRDGVDPLVRAYMYFCPVIIQYDVKEMVEIGSLDADLNLPATAKMGENYEVSDASILDKVLAAEEAVLEKSIDGGAWEHVTVWEGTGSKGQNTGGSIGEKSDEICDITYRITLTADDGQSDTAEKKISITDGREIEGQAILELDKYTYEGHPADAEDWSEFTIDGEHYSAKRAYEEGIAKNSYKVTGGTAKKDGYDAVVTFPKRGTYPVTLNVSVKPTGAKLTDTKTIEVRKTPYVMDSLGGFQKQNRKQVLTFKIATYPDKPITDYDITIKDLKSNEIISLTKDKIQENGDCIKTRAVSEVINDKYWTTLTVEFLTKYPRHSLTGDNSQRFSYKIKVTDSKGDTDEAYKEFDVVPDKPPVPIINMQTAFIRNEGTNTAKLETADGSSSDGDQLLRTWKTADHSPLTGLAEGQKTANGSIPNGSFQDATTLDGYENLAFGTNQTIGWNKEWVGKTTVKLHVKDIWIEPTLEEYISSSDYLEAETTAKTEVINIAPNVSIEPLDTLKANIAILVKRNQWSEFSTQKNKIDADLIEQGIDAKITFVPVSENYESLSGKLTATSRLNSMGGDVTASGYAADAERFYMIQKTIDSMRIVAYNYEGQEVWSYLLPKADYRTKLFAESGERYLICSNKASNNTDSYFYLFQAKTGALLKRIDGFGVSENVYVSPDGKRIYEATRTGIIRYDVQTGKITQLKSQDMWLPRVNGGEIGFVGKSGDAQYYLGSFDMTTEKITAKPLPRLDFEKEPLLEGMSWIEPVDWSKDGKVLVTRRLWEDYDGSNGGEAWLLDSKTMTQGHMYHPVGDDKGWDAFLIKDELQNCEYVGVSYVHKGTSKYYDDIHIYQHKDGIFTQLSHYASGKGGKGKTANAGGYDSKENKIYLIGTGYYGRNDCYDLNKNEWTQESIGLEVMRNGITKAENNYTTYYTNDAQTYFYIVQHKATQTEDEALYNSLNKNVSFKSGEENYIFGVNMSDDLEQSKKYIEKEGVSLLQTNSLAEIDDLAERIKGLVKEGKYMLQLTGKNTGDTATIKKNLPLEPNKEYKYSYEVQPVTGSAMDVLQMKSGYGEIAQGKTYYKEVIYKADLTNGGNTYVTKGMVSFDEGNFFNSSHWQNYAGYGGGGTGKNMECVNGPTISFNLEKDGYVDVIYQRPYDGTACTLVVDGKVSERKSEPVDRKHILIFLPKGKHTISYRLDKAYVSASLFKSLEIGYLTTENNMFAKSSHTANGATTITGKFKTGKEAAYTELQSQNLSTLNLYHLLNTGQAVLGTSGMNGYIAVSPDGRNATSVFTGRVPNSGKVTMKMDIRVTAPVDKMLWVSNSQGFFLLKPGESYSQNFSTQSYYDRQTTFVSDFYAVELPLGLLGVTDNSKISRGVYPTIMDFSLKDKDYFYTMNLGESISTLTKCKGGYEPPLFTAEFSTESSNAMLDLFIRNFTLTMENNKVMSQATDERFNREDFLSTENWIKTVKGSGKAEMLQAKAEPKDEDAPLIYKKGELIRYGINYSDYENDPSKCGYWLYAHTPYNDGAHENASILYDEDGNIVSVCGETVGAGTSVGAITIEQAVEIAKNKGFKVLTEPVDRFYVDGKYTVYHWEFDDTSRGANAILNPDGTKQGYPTYDKSSNTAELTFYVEGTANAPWITGISTSPDKVKENAYFSINIGIDDVEKDILSLTTEVYKDRKSVFTHRKKNILPLDANGNQTTDTAIAVKYPVINTGALPDKAQAGTYEVVCTVRDQTGAGLGSYKFVVVSDGKITGEVYHTEKWEENRKKYNLSKFKEEINKSIAYSEYMKLKEPRTRGTNVFWSGEKFMLQAAVASTPTKVTCSINGTNYSTVMKSTGKKNNLDETIYEGDMWEKSMRYKWGMESPEELTFVFTATYSGGTVKKHEVRIIVDNMEEYWRLHRVF